MNHTDHNHPVEDYRSDEEKSAAELAGETKEAAESRAAQLKEKAERLARDAVETGKQEAMARADGLKHSAAGEASRTADAMRSAAGRFPEGDLRGAAALQIADGLGAVADRIREKDLGEISSDLTAFARRNPLMFFAGAAVLGFAVARLAKATSESADRYADEDDVLLREEQFHHDQRGAA